MQSYYERLVKERGEAVARAYMRDLRLKRKTNKGGGFNSHETRQKALKARKQHVQPAEKLLPNSESREV